MPRHDFYCKCGHTEQDIVTDLVEFECPVCEGTMKIDFSAIMVNQHTNSEAHNGGMYGKWHHGFGCVVKSYQHKQELLKRYNVSEAADPVKGSRSWRDQVPDNPQAKTYDKAVELSESDVTALMKGDKKKNREVAAHFEKE